jgi:SAM-dependent methyltransferase
MGAWERTVWKVRIERLQYTPRARQVWAEWFCQPDQPKSILLAWLVMERVRRRRRRVVERRRSARLKRVAGSACPTLRLGVDMRGEFGRSGGMSDSTRRFSGRVANYMKYRPGYPGEMMEWLGKEGILKAGDRVADVGSGTGLLAEVFLEGGHEVIGVEPNREMREAGERYLAAYPGFRSIEGTAEATGLGEGSVDVVAAGQAFHWFDREKAREEFGRILKSGGWVVLVWNERRDSSSAFLREYEGMLRAHATEYGKVDHRRMSDELLAGWFAGGMRVGRFENFQEFGLEGVKGRLMSSSYVPGVREAGYAEMMEEVEGIFGRHQRGGKVVFEYETKVYAGRV